MIVIKFSVYNQRLRRITSGIIPSNAYGKLKFEFDFRTEDWNAVEIKTVNFSYRDKNYFINLDENNQCFVPKEVIYSPTFSVAIHGGDIVTNYVRNPVEGTQSNSPTTPDIFDDESNSDNINILDGGVIILDLTDGPTEDDESNPSDDKSVVNYIMVNKIPFYVGLIGDEPSEVEYLQLDTSTANYTNQGFYITTNSEGDITNAGYQLTINGNSNSDAQTFSIPANAVVKMAYRYNLGGTNTWLAYTFDTTDEANYWLSSETFTAMVNGEEVVYQTYTYNIDVVGGGDAITSTEYWRFEIEVTN